MNPSYGTRIGAALVIAALALPGSAIAKPRNHHRVHSSVSVVQPTITVPHKYDAGGDGGDLYLPAGVKANLFNPLQVIQGIGTAAVQQVNDTLTQAGLPPLPPLPTL